MTKKSFVLIGLVSLMATSCMNKDVFDEGAPQKTAVGPSNSFDFSTQQTVNLNVDYSAYETYGPVFFSVYAENPFEGSEENIQMKDGVKPIFESYTNSDRKYNGTVTLPSYAKKLYVVTGNFLVQQTLIETEVVNKSINAVAENYSQAAARNNRAAKRAGVPTTSLESLYNLSYKVDVTTGDNIDVQVCKEWHTLLGTWDSESGRPNYLINDSPVNPDLLFTEEEKGELYQTVANALSSNQTCNSIYRNQADLTLEKDAEVSLTLLGSSTCWNNTLGYYYYTDDNVPTSLMDVDIIMAFPNTQDGTCVRSWWRNPDFYGNIGLERGDAILLKYYPHIAQGDYSEATTIFPKGTKIGLVLKTNGWGMQKPNGNKKYYNSYKGDAYYKRSDVNIARQYNVWPASTEGLSYYSGDMAPNDNSAYTKPNPNGESRTAKFMYQDDKGNEYAIVSFEDACNDLDFDDLIFALKPVNAFATLPKVADKKTEVNSVYAFEDLWPEKGDYDMNDVVLDVKDVKEFWKKSGESNYKIFKQTFELTTYQNYVTKTSGLALTLDTKVTPNSIVMKKVDPATPNDTVEVNFTKEGNVYLLTEDVKGEINSTYILELIYNSGIADIAKLASIKPFIYRNDEVGEKRWEVHIPFEAPTAKMNTSYFGTKDDRSVPEEGKYFVRDSDYPFAFCLAGVTIDSFKNTILLRKNEKAPISQLYPEFLLWSTSKGEQNPDWYLHPAAE